jgi:Na+/proline symporter
MTLSLVPEAQVDRLATWLASTGGSELLTEARPAVLLRETLLYWVIAAVGITATVYTCAGGFRAAIWNDALQSLMLLGGAIVTLGYVMISTGTGPADWWDIASQQATTHTKPVLFSFDPTVRMTVFTAAVLSFFWTICTHGSDQVVLQRYFSTASLSAARAAVTSSTPSPT